MKRSINRGESSTIYLAGLARGAAKNHLVRGCRLGRRIEGLRKYQRRQRNGCFGELPPDLRAVAVKWLERFLLRWGNNVPHWRFAILVGQAKRLALHPPSSFWGRSMHAKRGGYAVQRRYRVEGRNPTQKATRVRVQRHKFLVTKDAREGSSPKATNAQRRHEVYPWSTPPEAVRKALQLKTHHPNLPPPPSPEARQIHRLYDPPGCRCYYCAWPNHEP